MQTQTTLPQPRQTDHTAAAPARTTTPDDAARAEQARKLLRHGAALFLLGLLTGFAIPLVENPRMGLSAHLEGVMNGVFLGWLGLVWTRLQLAARTRRWLALLALYGTYANWASTLLAAAWGTSRSTPIAGAGHAGEAWQEGLVDFGLFSLSVAMIVTVAVVWRGLRQGPPPVYSRG